MRIMLIQSASNIVKNRKEGKPALMPLGLMYIAGTLQANGYKDIEIYDCMLEGYYRERSFRNDYIRYGSSPEAIKTKIKEFKPDIIGVSVMCSLRKYHALEVCRLAKEVNPEIITVVGGNPVTCFPKWYVARKHIDYAILGEGEAPFLELVKCVEKNYQETLMRLNGIAWYNDRRYHIRPQKQWEKDLDKIPFPANNLINHQMYLDIWKKEGYQVYEARKFTMSTMARSCPFGCHHCPHKVLFGDTYRIRSAKNIFQEVRENYEKYGITEIQYHEYNALVNWKVVKEFCKMMIESGLSKKVRWGWPIGIWLKALTREKLELMREAGMDYVCLAIESYDQKKLDEVMPGKDVDLKHTLNVIKWCREFKYQIHAFFMLGLEGQTKEDIEKTIEWSKTLNLDTVSYFIAQPLPGSSFWNYAVKNKLFIDGFDTFHLRYGKANIKVTGLTSKELEAYRHRGRSEFVKNKGNSYQKRKEKSIDGRICG